MTDSLFPELINYDAFLSTLKQRIRTAQVRAALAVNQELVLLYWQIGSEILQRQQEEGWRTKVIERIAKDLKREFPDIKGFSRTNLLYMRAFAEAYPDESFVHQLGGQIPWRHNCVLLDRVKVPEQRVWYIQQTTQNGWSRGAILEMQIESHITFVSLLLLPILQPPLFQLYPETLLLLIVLWFFCGLANGNISKVFLFCRSLIYSGSVNLFL